MDIEMSALYKALEDLAIHQDRSDYVTNVLGAHYDLLGLNEDSKQRELELSDLRTGKPVAWLKALRCLFTASEELFRAVKAISPLGKYRYILFRETHKQAVYYLGEGPLEISKFPNEGKPDEEVELMQLPNGKSFAWLYL